MNNNSTVEPGPTSNQNEQITTATCTNKRQTFEEQVNEQEQPHSQIVHRPNNAKRGL